MITSKSRIFSVLLSFSALMCSVSCAQEKKQFPKRAERIAEHITYKPFAAEPHSEYILDKTVDLKGNAWRLPEGMTIICRGGKFRNGLLAGNGTHIKGDSVAFDHVNIRGTWNVPQISTAMFEDLSYDNALRDVVALSNPKMQNTITIGKGNYTFALKEGDDIGIELKDSVNLILDGTLTMKPSGLFYYDIICIEGTNIDISGKGSIIGDRKTHRGDSGEWGMGIRFNGAHQCSIDGLTIQNCWGDGIYISKKSSNIMIRNCNISKCRRQGVTVGAATDILIDDVNVSDIAGTKPEYAIDIEPNKRDSASNVIVRRMTTKNCMGAFKATLNRESSVTNVVFEDCKAYNTGKWPVFKIKGCKDVTVKGCEVVGSKSKYAIVATKNDNIFFRDNIFSLNNKLFYSTNGITIERNKVNRKK